MRQKVKLALIRDEAVRKITFKKRKKSFLKKLEELSTLCDIQAFAIVYSPYEPQPTVWPSPDGVFQVFAQFNNMSAIDQSKKMVNHESFLRQRIEKGIERRKKQWRENRWKEITQVMSQALVRNSLSGLNITDLNDLKWVVDNRLDDVMKRAKTLLEGNPNPSDNIFVNDINNIHGAGDVVVEDATMAEALASVGGTAPTMFEAPPPPETTLHGPLEFGMGDRHQWFMDLINSQDQIPFGGAVNDPFANWP